MKFIIEHLEPIISPWCLSEYKHISKIVGKQDLIFTNVKKGEELLKGLGDVKHSSVNEVELKNACILDPKAEKALSPKDRFDYLIFGGILGDDPPQHRTGLIKLKAEKRNLGPKQMSTDTAVLVAKRITEGKRLESLEFIDELELKTGEDESVILPYRYLVEKGKPVMAKGVREMAKKQF